MNTALEYSPTLDRQLQIDDTAERFKLTLLRPFPWRKIVLVQAVVLGIFAATVAGASLVFPLLPLLLGPFLLITGLVEVVAMIGHERHKHQQLVSIRIFEISSQLFRVTVKWADGDRVQSWARADVSHLILTSSGRNIEVVLRTGRSEPLPMKLEKQLTQPVVHLVNTAFAKRPHGTTSLANVG